MVGSAGGSSQKWFVASALVRDCLDFKGYRASMYRCAQQCNAHYIYSVGASERVQQSIIYDGKNLVIKLLFLERRDAYSFQNALVRFQEDHVVALERIVVSETIVEITADAKEPLSRIMHAHYRSGDSTSPECLSLADLASVDSEVTIGNDEPDYILRGFEDLAKLTPELSLYRCHLASKARHPKFTSDKDNIVYASWDFHNHLDGLHNHSHCPEIGLRFLEDLGEVDVPVNDIIHRRHKISVYVVFRKICIADAVALRLKDGTEKVEGSNGLQYLSFLYVLDPKKAKQFLDVNYDETVLAWNAGTAKKMKFSDSSNSSSSSPHA